MKSKTIKTPNTTHQVSPFITQRWSARSFADQVITTDSLHTLLEAASWSASSMNEQPWKYLYAFRGTQGFDRMHTCLMDGNQPWAANASVLLLSLAKRTFDRNGKQNRHAMHDLGAANTTLLLQAADMDIFGHMMGGFHMDQTVDEFQIDTELWEPSCFIALGYLDEPEKLEEPFLTRETTPRQRKPISEFSQEIAS